MTPAGVMIHHEVRYDSLCLRVIADSGAKARVMMPAQLPARSGAFDGVDAQVDDGRVIRPE